MPSAAELVRRADSIALAQAADLPGGSVLFEHVFFLKGVESVPTIRIPGSLTDRDDFNDAPFPYDFVRPAGRTGNCYATTYRVGRWYLLLLKKTAPTLDAAPFATFSFTPYWEALAPTNEQISGLDDRWVVWVRQHIGHESF
jgi:hypothetical protein